ncbi:RNA polymerase sigma factor [Adhaeretor mobilis]|uniref:ECF RNA polymerase sigma factor SigW n=1 Tax=Adhaeretor mobilis TaxID=1930276 RepID=A0A517N2Q5_9BACT|nr:sigma-70 family RNA polymerase sigma factor [Adhaeretor mobilis]QDT01414.1 ECF RNA polymerase sigma factor SigW [Adhaeretor mobilis]
MTTPRTEDQKNRKVKTTKRAKSTNVANTKQDQPTTTDEQLFESYRADGDSTVFAELVSRYQRELYNYLRRYMNDASLAEDVFQATFLAVHVKQHLFQEGRKFRPWLYTIATNQAIDAQRRNKRHRRLSLDQSHSTGTEQLGSLLDIVAGDQLSAHQTVDNNEQAQWVRDAVANLPESLRNAVNLVYFKGMKYRDAADAMSIPVGTVKSRLHSAISRLGDAWHEGKTTKLG